MNPKNHVSALIAEDEPLLAAHLHTELLQCWPDLHIVASVADGASALREALRIQPDLLFLDIHMPHINGLEVAQALMEEWDEDSSPLPLIVFVTAYDTYALKAFESAAFDYLLKPLQPQRLAMTVKRLQSAIATRRSDTPANGGAELRQLHALLQTMRPATTPPLRVLQVNQGNIIQMVKIEDILYFEAADKYLRVFTADKDYVIRSTLREIQAQLDSERFWQIHRGTIVRVDAIEKALRLDSGKLVLSLRGRSETLQVSRLYAHLFKGL